MTTLGKAYVQIMPSAQGISGSISKILDPEAKSAGESAGQQAGNNLVGTITKIIAAAGIGKLLKDGISASLSAGADIQQSFGGIDTLYTEASGAAKQYAADAYKAGISANTYAEQAVSFGASLKQALGGDTVKAAQMADKAIMAMADNSAKMGTDIGSIQQTFQGFAKQNYTMLDNLKLGYGGTKSEMQRLLDDASKLEGAMGKKFNLENFSDIVEAIDLVQQELGIAGVAAKEAEETFSGSLQAMKASFTNVLAALSADELDLGPQLEGLVKTTATFLFGNFIPMVGRIFKQLPSAIASGLSLAGPIVMKGLKELFPNVDFGMFSGVIEGLKNFGSLISFTIMDIKEAISGLFNGFASTGAFQSLVTAFKTVSVASLDLSEKLSGMIPWEKIGSAIGIIVKFLADMITKLAEISQSIDGKVFGSLLITIPKVIAVFKGLNFLKSFNPFSALKSIKIPNPFSILVNMARSVGSTVKSIFIGIGKGLSTVFQGIAKAISMLNPVGVASFALGLAAVTTSLVALSSVKDTVLPFLKGLAEIFVQLVSGVLQVFVATLASLTPVIATLASSLPQLSPLVIAFGTAFATVATALGGAIAEIVTALTPIVQIISTTFLQVVTVITQAIVQIIQALAPFIPSITTMFTTITTVVANAIVQIVQALAPFIPAVTEMVAGLAPVLSEIVNAFNNLINQIGPIIDSITNLFKTLGEQISSILKSAGSVVESFGSAIRNVLDGVAGIFESMGNAALNAGRGVKEMAQGIQILTKLGLVDLATTLATVAVGLTAIVGSGIGSAGPGLQAAGIGMQLMATSAQLASVAIQTLPTVLTMLTTNLGNLPTQLIMAGSSMKVFATSVQTSAMGLMAVGAVITQFAATMITIASASTVANTGLASFNGQANSAGNAMLRLGSASMQALRQVIALGVGIASSMANSTTVIANAGMQMTTTMRSAGTQMVTISQSTMNQIKSVFSNGMSFIVQIVRTNSSQMVSTWQSSGQQMVSTTQSFVSNTNNSLKNIGSGVNLHSNGAALMSGLKSGIDSGWSQITSSVSNMAQWIKDHKGPVSYDKKLLIENGRAIMYGLNQGIASGWEIVKSNISSMADQLARLIDSNLNDSLSVSNAEAELTKRVSIDGLASSVIPSNKTSETQGTLIRKVEELIEEVRRNGNTYLDSRVISRKVDSNLGQNTQMKRRTSWAT